MTLMFFKLLFYFQQTKKTEEVTENGKGNEKSD